MADISNNEPDSIKVEQNVSREIFDSFIDIKGLGKTLVDSLRKPKDVIDSFYYKKREYMGPVKYAVTVLTPYIIIVNILNLDIPGWLITGMGDMGLLTQTGDAEMQKEMMDIMVSFMSFYFEYLPAFYVVLSAPLWAKILQIFFRRKELKFSYYYGFSVYVLALAGLAQFPIMLTFVYADWNYGDYATIGLILSLAIIVRSCYLTFQEDLFAVSAKVFGSMVLLFISFLIIGGIGGIGLGIYLAITIG